MRQWKTLPELLAYAKANPQAELGHARHRSTQHLAMERVACRPGRAQLDARA